MVQVRDVVALLDGLYDPRGAEPWDTVGTIAGDLDAEVSSVLFAVDPVQVVADEAVERGVQLVVTHHPLFLGGTTQVSTATPKGRVVQTLVANGVALHNCHTNADSPRFGVSEAMANALGLIDLVPLVPDVDSGLDKWVVFVPVLDARTVADAMHAAGAGRIGNYDRTIFTTRGQGEFRPLDGANPHLGRVGAVERVEEKRLEMVADTSLRETIRTAMRAAHPYEEPAYDVWQLAGRRSTDRGAGRIGILPEPMSLRAFAEKVMHGLPGHHGGTRIAGDLEREIRTVALCAGSGGSYLDNARASGADVYVTSDLRHHPASEYLESTDATALIDVPHWAAEWTWLPVVSRLVADRLGLSTHVSTIVTDPWSATLVPEEQH